MKTFEAMMKAISKDISIQGILETINKQYGEITALQIREQDGSYRKLSYAELGRRVVDVSAALIKLGIQKNDRVAILSESRPEWAVAGFGIISAAAIIVPIDVKLSEKEIQFILEDSQAKCVFVSEKYFSIVDNLKTPLTHITNIITFDDVKHGDVILLKDLKIAAGESKYNPIHPDDTALIVYTSGTAGAAKGVELSYKNLLFQVLATIEVVHYRKEEQILSILPLNHMLELTGGLIAPLYAGSCVTYCDTIKTTTLTAIMKETHTTAMICVPLVLKMFHDGIMSKVGKLSPVKQKIFIRFLALSKLLLKLNIRAGRVFFASVHKEFGGRLKIFLSGGAPLNMEIERNLNALGFIVLQGYGLTETSPVISVNTCKHNRMGSVGIPLKGIEVKILKENNSAQDGEIITRGPHVMKGYYKNPEKTIEVIKDGWFYTGDTGYFDRDGFLYISGRLRNLIVLGDGKKVFPEEVEEVIGNSPYIKEICVLSKNAMQGAHKGYEEVYAVIVPNFDIFEQNAKNNDQKIKEKISLEIKRLSENLAEYKRITDFEIWRQELPKTTSKKIKRKEIADMVKSKSFQFFSRFFKQLKVN
ncbi:MAG: AMP-binding protein [Candidatus Omnitrophota bacterium]|nr:AMP-binding protein [Candidatus Omnitrophota bacterium]